MLRRRDVAFFDPDSSRAARVVVMSCRVHITRTAKPRTRPRFLP